MTDDARKILDDLDRIEDAFDWSRNTGLRDHAASQVIVWNQAATRQEKSIEGAPWKPLSPRYRREKERDRPGRIMSVYDGDLYTGLFKRTVKSASRDVLSLSPPPDVIKKLRDFNLGGIVTGNRQPMRPLWGLNDHIARTILEGLDHDVELAMSWS